MSTKHSPYKHRQSKVKWDDSAAEDFLQEKFTVKDVLRLFNISTRADSVLEDSNDRMQALLPKIREAQISAYKETLEQVSKRYVAPKPSCDILAIPSDSVTGLFAISETVLKEEEVLVEQDAVDKHLKTLRHRAIPNSSFKKPPKTKPPPSPTWEDQMVGKTMENYYHIYGPDKPRPDYPILPPRERPVVVPEETGKQKKKGKKGKKGRKKKKEKLPEEPFNMTAWRKENIPVASTKLWRLWFETLPCHQRTPNLSNPPTPPSDVPEPVSQFGHFISNLPEDRKEKRVCNTGHYSPRFSRSRSLTDVKPNRDYSTLLAHQRRLGNVSASSVSRPSITPAADGVCTSSAPSQLPKISAVTVQSLATRSIAAT